MREAMLCKGLCTARYCDIDTQVFMERVDFFLALAAPPAFPAAVGLFTVTALRLVPLREPALEVTKPAAL